MTKNIAIEQQFSVQRRRNLVRTLTKNGALIGLILLVTLLYIAAPAFRRPTSLLLIGLEASFIGIVAAGQTLVILTSGIDLSLEANVAFSGVMAAILISGSSQSGGQLGNGIPSYMAIPLAIMAGTLVGLLQGVIITGLNINPFIVTLGFLSILTGISLTVTRGSPINIANDDLMKTLVGVIDIGGTKIPVPLIITLVIYFFVWVLLQHTKLGRYIYAIGGNETAARLSGVNVNRTKILVYGLSGMLAAIAGILLMGRLQTGAYQNGTDYTLTSVAAVVIGGTALAGGMGGIWGTLIGVFIMRVVQAGLIYMNVPPNAHKIVLGAIIVLAVALDVARRGEIPWINRIFRRKA
ncbi:MAG TPA: ABC transporter permease, partial [Phototrophicaceae bacterium]|nr:ABC transporter permease [Phototrophicaceae bacterium]